MFSAIRNATVLGALALGLQDLQAPETGQSSPKTPSPLPELSAAGIARGPVTDEPILWKPMPGVGPASIYDLPAVLPDGLLNQPNAATLQDYARYFRAKGYSALVGRESASNFVSWCRTQDGTTRPFGATVVRCEGTTGVTAHLDVELPCGPTLLVARMPDVPLSDKFWGELRPGNRIEVPIAFKPSGTNGVTFAVDAFGTHGTLPRLWK